MPRKNKRKNSQKTRYCQEAFCGGGQNLILGKTRVAADKISNTDAAKAEKENA
jgi:hypothetical protein